MSFRRARRRRSHELGDGESFALADRAGQVPGVAERKAAGGH